MSDERRPTSEGESAEPKSQECDRPPIEERAQEEPVAHTAPKRGPAGEEVRDVSPRERRGINRRELLKLVPVIALGAFAIPKLQGPLLNSGLHLSDWASARLFGRHRLAQTYGNNDVASFERFPYNYYDIADPDVDLDTWTLTVEGLVRRPGEYTLQQVQAFPGRAEYEARLRRRLGCPR